MTSSGAIRESEIKETELHHSSAVAPSISVSDSFGTPELDAIHLAFQNPETSVNVTVMEKDVLMDPATPSEEQTSLRTAGEEEQVMEALSGEEEGTLDTSRDKEQPLDLRAGDTEHMDTREDQMLDVSEEDQMLDTPNEYKTDATREEEDPTLDAIENDEPAFDRTGREEVTVDTTGEEEPTFDMTEEEPAVNTTGEEEPAFDTTGEEEPAFDTTGEEDPAFDTTGEEEPTFDTTGEEESAFDTTGEEEPTFDTTGEEESAFDTTGEEEPTFDTTGEEEPTFDTTGEEELAFDTTGEEEPTFHTTGKEEPVFDTTKEEEPAFDTTGEEAAAFDTTGEQPAFDTTEKEEPAFDTTGEEKPFDTREEEEPSFDAERLEDQTNHKTQQDQMLVNETEEKADQTLDTMTETAVQPVGEGTAESSVLADSTSVDPTNPDDAEMSFASRDPSKTTSPAIWKSKPAERRGRTKRKSVETSTKRKSAETKVTKRSSSSKDRRKVPVPTVTVTAPSDQSDNSETGITSSGKPSMSKLPKRIETFNRLPSGWRRLQILRTGGKHAGRYDTTLFSETKYKMRSYPNVKAYLEKTGQSHLLDDEEYDFQFKQPFSERKNKQTPRSVKKPKNKPSTKSVVKSSKTTPKSSLTLNLKRKLPSEQGQDGGSSDSTIWEVLTPQKTKAHKRTILPSKPALQLKLDRLFKVSTYKKSKESHVENQPKESKFQSILKLRLNDKQSTKKLEKNMEDSGDVGEVKRDIHIDNVQSTCSELPRDEETEDIGCCDLSPKKSEDVDDMVDEFEEEVQNSEHASYVYLAEEEECPFKSEEEDEDDLVTSAKIEDSTIEMVRTDEEGEVANVPETSCSSVCKLAKSSDSVTNSLQSISVSRMSTVKRSLSPSDSDVSTHKRQRVWTEADIEEDSSRSVGMCSDTSMTGQEEDENQNMATKVQKMHLSDSSSSKDLKDSASTTSSNSSSQALTVPSLIPLRKMSRAKTTKSSASGSISPAITSPKREQTLKTNGSPALRSRLHRDPTWTPPLSPFNLIQERLCHDTWKMLVATIILREIDAESAIRLLWKFLNRWPTADEARKAEIQEIAKLFDSMKRNLACASTLVRFSEEYQTKDWKYPIELHGIEECGNDSYRIFCVREWREVETDDFHLKKYHQWLSQNYQELGVE